MLIVTPTTLRSEEIAWEGELSPLAAETFKGVAPRPRVALGKPAWWTAAALESQTGHKWSPPAGDRRYTLVRLSYTLYPPAGRNAHYQEATLSAGLRPLNGRGHAVAHALYPDRVTTPRQGTFSLKLTPQLKFVEAIDAKVGEAGVEIQYQQALPVVQSFGLGQNRPYWQFTHQAAQPLLGSISVYLVIDAPAAADTWLTLDLIATVKDRFSLSRLGVPETGRAHLAQAIR